MSFVHLRLHTEYSLSDGLIRVEPGARKSPGANVKTLTQRAAELGLPAQAVTDRSNLFAMVKFYKAAEAAGIKPLIGSEVQVEPETDGEAPSELTLLVQNDDGYRNLTQLLSRAYLHGQVRDVPLVRRQWLDELNDGLIALLGRATDVGRALQSGAARPALAALARWRGWFDDRLYLELTRCGRAGEEGHLQAACLLARASGTPVVATNDVRFLEAADFEAHEARVCIAQGRVLSDPRRPRQYSPEQYLKTAQQMRALFADLPQACDNTLEIARRCTLSLSFGAYHLPEYPTPPGMTAAAYLRAQARQGLLHRFARHPPARPVEDYQRRLDYELGVIEQMGFAGYFLVVADFIAWAKANGVPVGPGRGSGAGSLVAYAVGITDLDPLPYELLFERFLNPERVSMPDFDVDFCMEGRDRVIDYVAERFGRDRVGQIITYSSMAARAVVRDVARVLGYPYAVGDRIAKLIPGSPAFKAEATAAGCSELEYALKILPEFRSAYEGDEEVHGVVDLGLVLEGLTRGVGKHAGGVVIAPEPLTRYAPLYCEPGGGGLVTQFDMKDLETVGLVKFDFLGLRTLTIIAAAVEMINARNPQARIDPLALPLDDPATFKLYAEGHTTAVFQMESSGMQRASMELKPDRFEDLIALISLYRPGPMELIPEYVARKRGKKPEYLHPEMEPVLKPTYGIFVYQEQVMQIAQRLAGYTLGGADLLRRAMGKKKPEEMAKQRAVFVTGAAERGIDAATANAIFDQMEKFAGYGFNKSHAAAYALVSYQTAWLKAHYPAEFMAAVLSAEMNHTDTVVTMLDECVRMGLTMRPPDINASYYRFTVDANGAIVYGLGAIKGVGEGALEGILAERERSGAFRDLFDFCRRVDLRRANKRVIEALIAAGALDAFGSNRASLAATLPRALQWAEQAAAGAAAGQHDLFGLLSAEAPKIEAVAQPEWPSAIRLAREKEVLGLYLSGHPIEAYRQLIAESCSAPTLKQAIGRYGGDAEPTAGRRNRGTILIGAWLADIRSVGGERPGRLLLLDDRSAQLVCWLDFEQFRQYEAVLRKDSLVFASGEIALVHRDGRDPEHRLYARGFMDLDTLRQARAQALILRLAGTPADVERLADRLRGWRSEQGVPVLVEYFNGKLKAQLDLGPEWRLRPEPALLTELAELLGPEGVRLRLRRWDGAPAAGAE